MKRIGTIFTHNRVKLEVVKEIKMCNGCHFHGHNHCLAPKEWEDNHRTSLYRPDKQDIIYRKIDQ